MVGSSLMQSPWWITTGWIMVHLLWIGCVIGLFAAAGRWLLNSRPEHRYLFAVACFAALSLTPGVVLVLLHPDHAVESGSSGPLSLSSVSAEPRALAPSISVPPMAEAAPTEFSVLRLDFAVRYLPWLWLIGTPGTFVVFGLGLIGSERLRRQSDTLKQSEIANRCLQLAESLGVHCHVALGVCGRLATPILVGIFRPMILLPPAALSGWSMQQLEMVLLHELAHVRRWDNVVNLMQRVVESFLFFHPVVWWLSAWIRLERELCCDQIVVARTGDPRAYAETLATLARVEPIRRTGALAMAENRLVIRIRRILNLEDRSMCLSTKSFAFTSALLVAALISVGLYANGEQASPTINDADGQEQVFPAEKKATEPGKVNNENKTVHDLLSAGAKQAGAKDLPKGAKEDIKQSLRFPTNGLEAYQQVKLFSRVAGIVKTVSVDVGDRVKRGQVLAEVDAPDVELELKQHLAMVQQAKAETDRARSSIRAAQAVLDAAKALVLEAEAGVQGAKANQEARKKQVERLKGLWEAKAVDSSILEEGREKLGAAQSERAAAEAKWQAAKFTVEESTAKLVRAEADVRVALARVAVAEAGLQRTRALLDSATVRSPFDGVIVHRGGDVGAFSQAAGQINSEPLVIVARTDLFRIVFQMPESLLDKVSKGTPVIVKVHAVPNNPFEGTVARIAPSVDRTTRTVRAEIDLPNPDSRTRLLPGLSCTITLKLEK
jgi:multidrug resistance efflux pump/beta-lactamase regulating signal transducer with metallopeptidase domain